MITTLNKLKACQFGIITAVAENKLAIFQRLMEMGLIEGAGIEVLGFAPLGDPMRIKINNSMLALRKHEASFITVELLEDI
ncbi:MAG: FeoA family protein [Candidatus Buchananbacteria bacterium]|nr:FeoA family protein [Candidatus Buchananbacteria bacterium]